METFFFRFGDLGWVEGHENSPYLTITQSAPPQHVEGPISMATFDGKGLSFSGKLRATDSNSSLPFQAKWVHA